MKKALLLFLLMLGITSTFASLRQTKYRWRTDDGSETSATWKAAVNTPITLTDPFEKLRVRIEFDNDNDGFGEISNISQTLRYSKDGGTTWTNITNSTANDFVYVSSTMVTHGEATTNQITGTTGTFIPGKIVAGPPGTAIIIGDLEKTEVEWAIQATANLDPSTTYLFKVLDLEEEGWGAELGGTPIVSVFPTLTTPSCIAAVVSTTDGELCVAGSVELSATGTAGSTLKWYDSPTGGTLLATGNTYTTPVISTTTTYYVMAEATGCSSGRVPVTANINYTPITTVPDTVCGEGALTLSASSEAGATIDWYDDAAMTTLLFTGADYTTPVISSTTTYYAVATVGTCSSPPAAVTALVYDLPVIAVTPAIDTVCLGDTVAFEATVDPDYAYLWSPSGETGSLIHTPAPGIHTVTVTDEHGCSNSANGEVVIFEPISIDGFDYIPNIFSDPLTYRFFPIDPVAVTGYLWDFGDGTTSTEASPTHTYPSFGNYDVRLTVLNDCESDTIMLNINVEEENATTDLLLSSSLDIYPVPAGMILNMELTNGEKIYRVSLINQLGQVVKQESFSPASRQRISVAKLPGGAYFILIETPGGGRAGKKLMIQR